MLTPFYRRLSLTLLVGIGLVGTAFAETDEGPLVTVETIDGEFVGRLSTLNEQSGVRLTSDTFARLTPEEVLTVRFDHATRVADRSANRLAEKRLAKGVVTLVEGSRFAYQSVEFVDERVQFVLSDDVSLETRTEDLTEWRFLADPTDDSADGLEVTDPGDAADVLWVRRRDGELTPVSGVILSLNDAGVRFALDTDNRADADTVTAPWQKIAGMQFYRPSRSNREPPQRVITLIDGSRIVADTVSVSGERLVWRSDAGTGSGLLATVASIDLSGGRVVPVSRLELVSERWKPFFDTATSADRGIAFDASFGGGPISLRWPDHRARTAWPDVNTLQTYNAGVAMRSDGELQFALPDGAMRLKGWLGMDPLTANTGSAEVTVRAGGEVLWSGVVDGATQPIELNLALPAGARRLTLRVGYGDNLDAGDHLHFADLRVVQ